MKIKNFWKTHYYGFLAFGAGLGFLLLAKFLTFFLLFACLCFLGGAILNLVLTFKKLKIDNDEINIKLMKIEQILEEENETATNEQIVVNNKVIEKLNKDANRYKFSLAISIIIYLAVGILSIVYFVFSCFLL